MRCLYADTSSYSVAAGIFDPIEIDYSSLADAAKRDLYFRFAQDYNLVGNAAFPHCWVFNTAVLANQSITVADLLGDDTAKAAIGVVAYDEFILVSANPQTLTFTNLAANPPVLTNLRFRATVVGSNSEVWNAVMAVSSAPAADVLAAIDSILCEYMGTGAALEDFIAARLVQGAEEMQILSNAPLIVAAAADDEILESCATYHGIQVNFSIIIGARGVANKGEDSYRKALHYAGAVRSIIGDERRDLDGLGPCTVTGVESPQPVKGDSDPYVAAKVNGYVRFPLLSSD